MYIIMNGRSTLEVLGARLSFTCKSQPIAAPPGRKCSPAHLRRIEGEPHIFSWSHFWESEVAHFASTPSEMNLGGEIHCISMKQLKESSSVGLVRVSAQPQHCHWVSRSIWTRCPHRWCNRSNWGK